LDHERIGIMWLNIKLCWN